jgi:hypothetical protein
MTISIEGFYTAYLSGEQGRGLAMFIFENGLIVGADAFGVMFDGKYYDTETTSISVSLTVKTPPNVFMINGGTSGPHGEENQIKFDLTEDFASRDFIRLEGPRGPVNVKLVKNRNLHE